MRDITSNPCLSRRFSKPLHSRAARSVAGVMLSFVLGLSPLSAIPANAYYCGNPQDPSDHSVNCYGYVEWDNGAGTIGATTQMYLTSLSYGSSGYFLDAEMWLVNTNTNPNEWVEVGATADDRWVSRGYGTLVWFYGVNSVYAYDENPLGIGTVPSADVYNWIPMWIVRDDNYHYSAHVRSTAGEQVQQVQIYLYPNLIADGQELFGQDETAPPASSNGSTFFTNNTSIYQDGTSFYEFQDGQFRWDAPFQNLGWLNNWKPSNTSWGGTFMVACCNT